MRILVTGASGFIGAHLCRALMAQRHTVTGLDTHPALLGAVDEMVIGSVTDIPLVDALVAEHDAVVHLACVVGYARVMANIEGSVYTTTIGTAVVARACTTHGKRLLFTSTSAVYGHGMDRRDFGARETDALKLGPTTIPSWAYAYAKAAAECHVLAAYRERSCPAVIVRLFNVVGPGQSAQAGFVLPRFVASALRGEPLRVYAPGTQTRTFCHIDDVVQGLVLALQTTASYGHILNLGGTATVSVQDLAQRVNATLRNASGYVIVPAPYKGYEEIRERRPDLTKAKRLLGYEPTRTLEDMIKDTAEAVAPEVLV